MWLCGQKKDMSVNIFLMTTCNGSGFGSHYLFEFTLVYIVDDAVSAAISVEKPSVTSAEKPSVDS